MRFEVPSEFRNHPGIYTIVNTVNGKSYVGSAVAFGRRFRQHHHDLRQSKHRNQKLQRAFDKYGADVFCFRLVEVVRDAQDLTRVEQEHLDRAFLNPERTYNICVTAGSSLGMKRSPESVQRVKEGQRRYYATHHGTRLGIPNTPETRQKIAEAHFGVACHTEPHSEESKAKISLAKRGKKITRSKYDVTLTAPDGRVLEHVKDLKNFARAEGLNAEGVYKLVRGGYAVYKGWTALVHPAGLET